jgi:hypothetical protein
MAYSHGSAKIKRQKKDGSLYAELNATEPIPGDPYSSTENKELAIPEYWVNSCDKASTQESLMFHPGKEDWRKRFIYTLLKWSESDGVVEILQFCKKYKIPYKTIEHWIREYEDVKDAYRQAMLNIACNRRVGSIYKKFDSGSAYKDMHYYDPAWREIDKYNAEMNSKRNDGDGATILKLFFDKPGVITEEEMSRKITSKKEKDEEIASGERNDK